MVGLIVALVAILLFLFLVMPSLKRHPKLKVLCGMYIAHRGLHNIDEGIPENSLTAFRLAAAKGYAIENDIRLTKDGEVVVFHDSTLERVCGVDKRVSDLTLKELKEYTLFNTDEKIPTLKECLKAVDAKVPLLIEFKADLYSPSELFKRADEILHSYNGEYFIQSFDPRIVAQYRKYRPDICRGQLSTPYYKEKIYLKLLGSLSFNFVSRPHFVSYEHKYKNNMFFRINKLLGAFPVCWTLKSSKDLTAAKPHFKAYIFEGFEPENE